MVLEGTEGAFETSSLSSQLLFFSPGLCLYLLGCICVHAHVCVHVYMYFHASVHVHTHMCEHTCMCM